MKSIWSERMSNRIGFRCDDFSIMGESSLDKNVQMTIPYLDIYVNIKKKYICV